jgi:hypothetical protein
METNILLSWMAGFFEGEGSIGISTHGDPRHGDIQVQIDQDERILLELFQKEFGGVIVPSHRDRPWHEGWKWRIVSRMALRFALALFPYLHGDKTKAKFQKVFDFYKVNVDKIT